ncbi:MAG: T9SS type A sorting domain-containing protein [Calditrichaeota bacterium]|nr:T9SS type A sorting domain-containing protein [Calditrichota bacterium]MBT7370881.1 T9SS type A sorting domain-containing protein [Gammaproteobacteria bacterium]
MRLYQTKIKSIQLCFITLILFSFMAPVNGALRDIIPFPQQATQMGGDPLRMDMETAIVISDDPSQATLSGADSLVAAVERSMGYVLRIVNLADWNSQYPVILLGLSGELPEFEFIVSEAVPFTSDLVFQPEGYVLLSDISRLTLISTDLRGMTYGINTVEQLLTFGNAAFFAEQVLIFDYPDFQDRMLNLQTNFMTNDNVPAVFDLLHRMYSVRMNTVALRDFKFNLLQEMPDRYLNNAETARAEMERLDMYIVPQVAPFGYSEGLLRENPNNAEGVPVVDARFIVEDGFASLDPDPGMILVNGNFEDVEDDAFGGWRSQENVGVSVFDETNIVFEGEHSVRMENFRQGNEAGNCRFTAELDCEPWRNYHFSVMCRTDGLQAGWGVQVQAYGMVENGDNRRLVFPEFNIGNNADWTKLEVNLNSLDHNRIRFYFGVWGGEGGRAYFDDARLTEIGLVNLLRREGCPFTVTSEDGETEYVEGEDFATVIDTLTGMVPYAGNYDIYHTPPEIEVIGNRINDGDALLVDFYHPIVIHNYQVMCCPSEEAVYDLVTQDAETVTELLQPDAYFLSHDEIRVLNWDAACQQRGMTPAEILADNVQRVMDIYRGVTEDAELFIWSDMFDPFHNANDNYYLVNGDLTGSAELIPNDLIIVDWNTGEMNNSLGYFKELGFEVAGSVDCSSSMQAARPWAEALRCHDGRGMIYTTWNRRYDFIEDVGPYMWSIAPHIVHHYSDDILERNQLFVSAELFIDDDPGSAGVEIDQAFLYVVTNPDSAFEQVEMYTLDNNVYTSRGLILDQGHTGIKYYIEATDTRGNTTYSPVGAPEVQYLVGEDWAMSTPNNPEPPIPTDFSVSTHPNPFNNTLTITFTLPEPGETTVTIWDTRGRQVAQVLSGDLKRGKHVVSWEASGIGTGVYFCKVGCGEDERISRVVLVR